MSPIVSHIGVHADAAGLAERVAGAQAVPRVVTCHGRTAGEARLVSGYIIYGRKKRIGHLFYH